METNTGLYSDFDDVISKKLFFARCPWLRGSLSVPHNSTVEEIMALNKSRHLTLHGCPSLVMQAEGYAKQNCCLFLRQLTGNLECLPIILCARLAVPVPDLTRVKEAGAASGEVCEIP